MKGRDYTVENYAINLNNKDRASVRKSIKTYASDILETGGNRLKLIEAAILMVLMIIAVGGITAAVWIPISPLIEDFPIYGIIYEISVFIDYVLMFLFVFPLAYGMLTLAHRMCGADDTFVADAFYAYKRLMRTWLVMFISFVPWLIIVGAFIGAGRLMSYIKETLGIEALSGDLAFILKACVVLTAGIIIIGALVLAIRGFFFPGFAMRGDMNIRRALSAAFSASHRRMREIIAFVFSFTGWAALSICTLGVIFIMQMVPIYMTSYMIYCGEQIKKQTIEECDKGVI